MAASAKLINLEIRALALPNVISNVSVPLISSVDTFLMGQQSVMALAAVGVGSMIFNFLYWNMGFLRMGTTGLTAQAFGTTNQAEMGRLLLQACFLSLVISSLFLLFQSPLFTVANWAMASETNQIDQIWDYYRIRILGAPAALLLMAMMGWLFGMQNAKYPLWITIFINIVNIGISTFLVRSWSMGVSGVAWGTVAAQYGGVILCAVMIFYRYDSLINKKIFNWKLVLARISNLVRINKDIFIRTVFLSSAFLLIYRFSPTAGPDILAVNVVFMQFLNWMSYAIDGFAYAAESLVGKYKGARDEASLQLSIIWNMRWGFALAIGFSLIYALLAEPIFSLFIDDSQTDLLDTARPYFIWLAFLPIAGFSCYIWDGICVGLTASKAMRNSMFVAFAIYLIVYLVLPSSWGNHRIWTAFLLFLLFRGIILWALYKKYGWDKMK